MGAESEREKIWKRNWPNVPDTSEFVDRVASKVEARSGSRIPPWAWKATTWILGAIVLGAVGFGDYWRIKNITDSILAASASCDERAKQLSIAFSARFESAEARLAEGERIRIKRLDQLDDHEKRIAITVTMIEQLMKSIERLETKIDKLKDRP